MIELLFGLAVFGAITLGFASFAPHSGSDSAVALPPSRDRDLARAAAREHMAAILATPFEKIPQAFGEDQDAAAFDVERLSPAVPGRPVGSTEVGQVDDALHVTVRVVWQTHGGSADRLELQRTITPAAQVKGTTAAAVSAAPAHRDLPFDIDAMTLITASWMSLVGLILIGAIWHRPRCCSAESLGL